MLAFRFSLRHLLMLVGIACVLLAAGPTLIRHYRIATTPVWIIETPGHKVQVFVDGKYVGDSPIEVAESLLLKDPTIDMQQSGAMNGVFYVNPYKATMTTVITTSVPERDRLSETAINVFDISKVSSNSRIRGRITLGLVGPSFHLNGWLPVKVSYVLIGRSRRIEVCVPASILKDAIMVKIAGVLTRRDGSSIHYLSEVDRKDWIVADMEIIAPFDVRQFDSGTTWVEVSLAPNGSKEFMNIQPFLLTALPENEKGK